MTVYNSNYITNTSTFVMCCIPLSKIGPLSQLQSTHHTDLVQRRDQLGAACGLDPPETLCKEKRCSHRTVDDMDSALL